MRVAMDELGVYHINAPTLFSYLQAHLPIGVPTPSLSSLRKKLRRHFHLRYKSLAPAMVRYVDPTFNEKRLWAARLLA